MNAVILDEETFLAAPVLDTSLSLELSGVKACAAVKSKLLSLYGANACIVADGKRLTVGELDEFSSVSAPAQKDHAKARYTAADVVRVIARLARDGDGCPWDRAQTHESIRINMIEEAYEAVDAIDKRDIPNMREEFGDVFLQSVLQSEIARKNGEFDFSDVCDELCKKLIGRHTFIFGEDSAGNADEALGLWEKAKGAEKHYDSAKTQLQKLPQNFPSLLYAQKTHKKIKKAGGESDPRADLDRAIASGDYTAALYALAAVLSDEGKDAEVELNRFVKGRIAEL